LKLQVLPPAVFKEVAATIPHELRWAVVKNTEQGIVMCCKSGTNGVYSGSAGAAPVFSVPSTAQRRYYGSMVCCNG